MEKKKSDRANLENKKLIFLQVGFIVTLAVVLLAFEWRNTDKDLSGIHIHAPEAVEIILPINTVQPKPLPPPPAPKPFLKIIEKPNDADIPDDDHSIDAEMDPDAVVPDFFTLPEEPEQPADDVPFIVVQQMPEFPGGLALLYKYLQEHINYPEEAKSTGISGIVYVNFIIERDGSVSSVKVLRSPHPLLSEEAVRVVTSMPDWIPGKQRDRPVRVSMNIPIRFSLH
jgi:protein TonB